MLDKPLCMAPFRNVGTFYKEGDQDKYTPCCYRDIQALNASHWQDEEILELRKGLAGISSLHPDCEKCLSYGDLSTAKLYEVSYGTLEAFGFEPETGKAREANLTSSIYIGPTCNLACRMCSGHVSTSYNYVHKKLRDKPVYPEKKQYSMDVHNGVTSVCVAGGEPLMIDHTIGVVEQIAERGNGASAFIITNGSIELEGNKVYETIKRHRANTWVLVSLDADFDTHAWIRIGLDKDLLERNIQRLYDDGVLRGFNIVVSKMNYNKWLFPVQLATDLGIEFDITYLNTPEVFSCKHVELEKREQYAREVIQWTRENYHRIHPKCKDVLIRAIKALTELPYIGESDSNERFQYLTRII